MKKRTLSVIILSVFCLIAFVACNLDALDGIYSEVSDSTENTNVNVRGIIGQGAGDRIFYLTDEDICSIDYAGGDHKVHLSNTGSENIIAASVDGSSNLLVLTKQRNSKVMNTKLSYYEWNGASYDAPVEISGAYSGLLRNGLFFDDNAIYYYNAGAATSIVSSVEVIYYLETDDYAFFNVVDKTTDTRKLYVIKNDGTKTIDGATGSTATYVGFQPYSDGFAMIRYDSSSATFKAYLLEDASGVKSTALFTLKSSLPYAYAAQAATFCYTDTDEFIVVKATNYFDRFNVDSPAVENLSSGFASQIRTADIVNIMSSNTAGEFLVATYESFLYKINPSAGTCEKLNP